MPSCGINFRYSQGFRLFFFLFLVSIILTPVDPLQAQAGKDVVVTNRFANIRTGPGTRYTRIGRVYRGERFAVIDTRPGWHKIMQSRPSQMEIDKVGAEINRLNNRLDGMLEKLDEAAERLAERIEADNAQAAVQEAAAEKKRGVSRSAPPVSPAWMFVPGGPRLAAGHKIKGLGLIAATAGCLATSVYYHGEYRDYRNEYRALPAGSPPEEFEDLHEKSVSRRRISESFLYAAAGLYAVNLLDYFLFLPRSGIGFQVKAAPASGQKVQLSMSRAF